MPHGARGLQAFAGDLDIEIVFERALDQPVQDRVVETAPPMVEIGDEAAGCFIARLPIGRRVFGQVGDLRMQRPAGGQQAGAGERARAQPGRRVPSRR